MRVIWRCAGTRDADDFARRFLAFYGLKAPESFFEILIESAVGAAIRRIYGGREGAIWVIQAKLK
jgi:hypothetical protein